MKNAILESLPQSDRQYIHASMVLLKRSVVLCEPGEEPEYVYFPVEAIVSYVSSTAEGQSIEVGLVGNEGMVSVATIFGSLTAFRAVVQVAAVRRVFLGYANALLTQIAQTAVCNKFHSIEARFCRWLLMIHERSEADRLPITHDAVSRVLGTRRASVTIAAGKLQRAGAIRYIRGMIEVIDRSILKQYVCECYETIVSAYSRSARAATAYATDEM